MSQPSVQPPPAVPPSLMWKSLQALSRFLSTTLFDLKVYGTENIPKTGGAILAANHQSYLDPILVAVQLRRPISFMAKSELFRYRAGAWFIRSLHAFPVRQGEGDVAAVKETIRQLQAGNLINIYPEGSRTLDGEVAPLLPGIGLIVRRAGVPVVPIAIEGSFAAWPRDRARMFRPHPVWIQFGPPMQLQKLKAHEIVGEIEGTMRKMLAELRSRVASC